MQISALELEKLLAAEQAISAKKAEADLKFAPVTPDSLPETKEPDAEEVARVVEIVKAAPDIREDLVARLRERIEKGEYKIDSNEIAEMMMRRARADRIR
jgi:flagellar biosynthesis anti-sigma factor FlgM